MSEKNFVAYGDAETLFAGIGNKIRAKVEQVSTMPVATSSIEGKVVQFIGTTDTYTHGYFYECKQNGGTYAWVNVPVSAGGSGGHTILNGSGSAMSQRSKLQFVGATVSDDSENDATVVMTTSAISSYKASPTTTEVYDAAYINNKQAPKQYTITASSWSASQTTKDGVGYYTYSLALNPISKGRAEISIGNSATSGRLIPTDAEMSAYNLIDFASTDDSTGTPLTLYAKVKPSTTFTIIVIAHEKDYS